MITDVNLTHSTSRAMMSRPLKRGRACMNCRFLKIKCDGIKPICGPCRKHPKDDECEYSDGPARSRTKALEDTVQRLEARLHELEHPEDSTPSVTLYDPRSLPNTPYHQQPRVLSPSGSSPESQGYTPLSPFSPPSTTATTPPFGTHGHGSSPLGIFDSRVMTTPESSSSSLESDHNLCEVFLQTFRPHASEFGFFLNWSRFIQSTVHRSSALLNALYMWGAHLSSDRQREGYFKHKALQSVAADLTPQSFLHTLQAEVLLSHFFFRTGHFLEARAHTATAVALALGAGLHQIRSLNHPDAPVIEITEENDQEIHLRASADAIEEGERINGFWAVFMLQKNLSVALEHPARVCGVFEAGGMQIDTPWPLEMDDYKQGLLTSDIHGDSTVRNFLQQTATPGYHERPSITALNVKACILLHRAVYMHGQYRPNVPEREAQSWWTAFGVVDQLINSLRSELPDLAAQLQVQGRSPGSARTILLTHSLLNAATIKLHSIFYTDPTSRQNCLAAARDMFRFGGTNPQGLGYLNPMMGTLWMTACSVFIDELRRIRATAESAPGAWPLQIASESEREKEMLGSLHDGLDALSAFARESLLMRHQLTKVQESMGAGPT
ncbi:hypothetical protein MVEN_00602000 [Mycena venus]|uniref:Zn(2)-C6 fungal-type domain-containing protein n=1 Tax=Mycena venus TaxID=2733690 RepID=A0A8H6YRC3_9AGAR|nr:hypothetical protein MVEN_00602000 [Mycena venus]